MRTATAITPPVATGVDMDLGTFSISLSVKDLATTRDFYEKLGFTVFHDASDQKYLILRNGECTLGLFEDMFEGNILTFNPGWDRDAQALDEFEDVRDIQAQLKAAGVELLNEAVPASTGPENLMLTDPEGNVILIDQHVSRPGA
jgi:catechol 2,3-dioxygenase-like lactoylglutathione lyase family enzyme